MNLLPAENAYISCVLLLLECIHTAKRNFNLAAADDLLTPPNEFIQAILTDKRHLYLLILDKEILPVGAVGLSSRPPTSSS